MANEILIDRGGPVLQRAKIVLSFRGLGWLTGSISTSDVIRAFNAALASPYLSHLVQYRGIRRAEIVFAIEDWRDLGKLGPDPRNFVPGNIWLVSDEEIKNVARVAMRARPPEDNEEVFYLAVVSQNPIPIVVENIKASGYHDKFDEDGRTVTYGVLLHQSANTVEQSWQYLPGVFTHELVEACTDPDVTSGFIVNPGWADNGAELCDMNQTGPVQLPGFEHEVNLAMYWSELEQAAVVPTAYSLRVALGKRLTDSVPSVRALIQGISIRDFILAGCNP
jgi:hypothetical protein